MLHLSTIWKRYFQPLYYGLWPLTCLLCGLDGHDGRDLCRDCYRDLPWLGESVCVRCATSLPAVGLTCGRCLQKPPLYQRIVALWHYQTPLDHLLLALKFKGKLVYAKLLGELLRDAIVSSYAEQSQLPELIIPVPLHKQRLKERGFNQALELARPLKKLGIKIDPFLCQRIRATEPQMNLPAKARHTNVKRAFTMVGKLPVKHVAIVDDVVTTGHTITELCKVLRKAGAERIDVWCCAKSGKN